MKHLKRLTSLVSALVLALVAVTALNTPKAHAAPALVQSAVTSTASTTNSQSVTLTNVQAGDVLFAWGVSSVSAQTNHDFWHQGVNDSSSLGWHAATTASNGWEAYGAYWPATQNVMVTAYWANVPANISSLTVYHDLAINEPAASFIVAEFSGVQAGVTRTNYIASDSPASCASASTNGSQALCNMDNPTAPGVRIFCSAYQGMNWQSSGLSNWTVIQTTNTYGAACTYKVGTSGSQGLNPTHNYTASGQFIAYGFNLPS